MKLSGSQVSYITALSPGHLGTGGSTNPKDLSNYTWGTLLAVSGSQAADTVLNVERSATSNGTFGQVGCSITMTAGSGQAYVRSFPLNSSAVWYRVSYNFGGVGSLNATVLLIGQDARIMPITQDSATTVHSDCVVNVN